MKLPKPVPYARHWWRMHTVRLNTLGAVLTAASAGLSLAGGAASWVSAVDFRVVLVLAAVIFVASTAGALITQEFRDKPPKPTVPPNAGKTTQ